MGGLTIADRTIGAESPVFIVAEAGVNHNGDVRLAQELVREARRAGANCVKFQTFKAERVVTESAPKARYQLQTTDPNESQIEMLRKLELPEAAHREVMDVCREEGIVFLSTPYNEEDVDLLDRIGAPAFKLASIHAAEPEFLRYVARRGRPMILSTGMATLGEVDDAVRAIRSTGNEQFALLQCTTNYPSRAEDANLRAMTTMREAFNTLVGYSDHTQSDTACLVAVALGACIIEKHFTLDKALPGPDQSSSADPREFRELVRRIREAEAVLGSGRKEPVPAEVANAAGMRRSIVVKRPIHAGEKITADALTFKRPGTGVPIRFLEQVVGRRSRRDLSVDAPIEWSDLD